MLFQTSAFCFILILLLLFYIFPGSARKWVLLLASLVFIRWQGGISGLLVIAAITLIAYASGIAIGNLSQKGKERATQIISVVSIIFFVMVLFGWKYLDIILSIFPVKIPSIVLNAGIPIGLSFYSFQAISYMADLRLGKMEPHKNFIDFALYMVWFPKWMSGPIERVGSFTQQIEKLGQVKLFDENRIKRGLSYTLWGLFMKLVIADRLGVMVDTVYSDIPEYGALTLALTAALYSIQIYCDFAGYTNTMIGISSLFGLELTQNFRIPYLAENVVEFWRRWHISLSSFLKDYIYIPLGGNRKGNARKALNTIVVFIVCGAWHGAGLSFLAWGLMHGIFNVLAGNLKKGKANISILVTGNIGRVVNFIIVTFAWIFFRASSFIEALSFVKGMLPFGNSLPATAGFAAQDGLYLGASPIQWIIGALAVIILVVADIYSEKRKELFPELIVEKWSIPCRAALLTFITLVILIFGKYGLGDEIRSFVYMQF